MPQSNHYDQLIAKLDRFTRKYYINQVTFPGRKLTGIPVLF